MGSDLLEQARNESGLTQHVLAERARTSRPTLSAYEHGRKSPTLETTERILDAAGFRLKLEPKVVWSKVAGARSQVHYVPSRLFHVPLVNALGTIRPPLHLNWSTANRSVNLGDARQRRRWYEVLVRKGTRRDLEQYLDGALFIDAWPDMVVPRVLRRPWDEAIARTLNADG